MTAAPLAPDAWSSAPCGLLLLDDAGLLLRANDTVARWTGRTVAELEGGVRLPELLAVAGRIYWETHLLPLLRLEGAFAEVALDLRGDGGRLPVLLSAATVAHDGAEAVSVSVTAVHERHRYERELLGARRAAERSAASLAALQAVTSALSSATGVRGVAQALVATVTGHLAVADAAVWVHDEQSVVVLAATAGSREWDPVPPAHGGPVTVVRLPGRSGTRGLLALVERGAPGDDPLDGAVLEALAAQAGTALDRAELFDRSHDVALRLQRSLLGGPPRDDARFSAATVYRPAVEALEVGGDWHDVFALPGTDRLAVVVGDVVGRGLDAASAMGQLRSAVRAVAGDAAGPGAVLRRLDAFAEQAPAAAMATIVYGELDLRTGTLRYACAGHPPPVLLSGGGSELLWGGRSAPLAATGSPDERPEAVVRLAPGDALLMYTDGLVERRDRDLDDGLELLRAQACRLLGPTGDVPALTTALLADEVARDDVCVLLLTWRGDVLERSVTADLHDLGRVRRELRTWLRDSVAPVALLDDVVLATSEALANAAEHGERRLPGASVQVRAEVEGDPQAGTVRVRVQDSGTWRPPAEGGVERGGERGRGLRIMEALVDDVAVSHDRGTTVELRRGWGRG